MLKSIELTGFKSFAKRSNLNFKHSVTAIVGPNGSGKSNTAEAFRFVLGEQGGKSLRVKKGTELIWAGSNAVPKSSFAGVRIVLDNSSRQLGIDFDEVVIERSVLRDGTHEYSINGSKVRLKDIQDLLASANIGSSGHHIISQGQADRILGASPKERRVMLEDALGLKSYINKKVEAERKLLSTKENLAQAKSSQRELVPQLKYLKSKVDIVLQTRELTKELEDKFGIYVTVESAELDRQQKQIADALTSPKEELSEVEATIESLRGQIDNLTSNGATSVDDSEVVELRASIHNIKQKLSNSRQELGKVLGQLELLGATASSESKRPETVPREAVRAVLLKIVAMSDNPEGIKEIAERFMTEVLDANTKDKSESINLDSKLKELQVKKDNLELEIIKQEASLQESEARLRALEQAETGAEQEATTLERDLYKATARYNELQAKVSELEHQEQDLLTRRARLAEDIAEVEALLRKRLTVLSLKESGAYEVSSRRELERLKLKVEAGRDIDSGVVEEYKELKERYDFLENQIVDLQSAVEKLIELMSSLEQEAQHRFDEGLDSINKQFQTFFKGLFGGGDAMLSLEQAGKDEGEDAKPGIVVDIKLPRKKVKSLETLSGGERALASIALIFAMSQVNPPPFIILDETDAALDEANSRRYAEVVRELSSRSQIILITHNRATMAVADTLYGVTMGNDGVSKLLSVQLTDAEQFAK